MKKLFFIISLLISAALSAQNYPIISPYPNPMFKYNCRVGDSLYVGDDIAIGIDKKPEAAFHIKTKNNSATDTSILIEDNSGIDHFWMANDGPAVFRPAVNLRTVIQGNTISFIDDGGIIRDETITGNIVTWNYVHWASSNLGIGVSNPIPMWDFTYLVANGTALPGDPAADGIGINAHPTYNTTALNGAKFLVYDPVVTSLVGVHYFIYATSGLTKLGTVPLNNSATKIGCFDASNVANYMDLSALTTTVLTNPAITGNIVLGSAGMTFNGNRFLSQPSTQNLFIGELSGGTASAGNSNVGIGYLAMSTHTSGQHNTVVGWMAGDELTTARRNTLFGSQAGGELKVTATDEENCAFGYNALTAADGSQYNSVYGSQAGLTISTGDNNTLMGRLSGSSLTTGSGNVFIGYSSGSNETGSNKLYIENSNSATPLIGGDFSIDRVDLNGGVKFITTSKTGNYTASVSDFIIYVDASGGAVNITLPAAATSTIGQRWEIYKTDASANAVTVTRAGSDTINGATSKSTTTQYNGIQITGRTATTWQATSLVGL